MKRKLFISYLIAILAIYGCGNKESSTTLFPFLENDKYGYINAAGSVIIKPKYDYAGGFHEDRALVMIDNKFAIIDMNQNNVYLFTEFDRHNNWNTSYISYCDRFGFSEGLLAIPVGGKWGFINKEGETVIEPKFCSHRVPFFSEGLVNVQIDSMYGFIDKTGNIAIKPIYKSAGWFSEGLAPVKIGEKNWGYIDKSGSIVIEPKFYRASPFSDGRAPIRMNERLVGFIDKTGKIVIEPKYTITDGFRDGLACVEIVDSYSKSAVINKMGNFIIEPTREYVIFGFYEGLAKIRVGEISGSEKWGYIDKTGEVVIEPKFDFASDFSNGLARVLFGDYSGRVMGYIDKKGNYIWGPK
ncbi:MAG: WG repeat-containing protein [Candidatus Hatepunaea meridiana]|nr:WG repeat-containing protein [Candidatus Hatepunaea meridiana]